MAYRPRKRIAQEYLTQGQYSRHPRPILKMTMAAGDFFDVYLGLFNGTMIDGANWRALADYDPRTRPWYMRAMEEQKLTLTRPFMDAGTWKMVIAVVVPLVHNNQVIGVLSANIILLKFPDFCRRINLHFALRRACF